MSKIEWETLLIVDDRIEAEILKGALEAQGILTEIFQEGAIRFGYPVNVGPLARVEICVPSNRLTEAQAWLEFYKKDELRDEGHGDPGHEQWDGQV
jgi:hypothetical protein